MKMTLFLLAAVVVMLATLFACEWLVNRKHARRQVRQWLAHGRSLATWIMFGVSIALGYVTEVRARIRHKRMRLGLAGNVYTGQDKTHQTFINRTPDASVTVRHLLYKKGTDNQHVAVLAAQTDVPLGVIADEWDSTKDAGQPVGLIIIGCGPSTVRMRANAAGLAVGDIVFGVAGGYVDKAANLTGSSTAYQVGIIVDIPGQTTTAAQGDVVEVSADVPSKVTT